MSAMPKKFGPAPLPATERRLRVQLSLSNKNYPRLRKFRSAVECKEGGAVSDEKLVEIAQDLAYHAIDAYCDGVERDSQHTPCLKTGACN